MEQVKQTIQPHRKWEVNIIPATKRALEAGGQIRKLKSIRVAAYCRVSTGDESQQTSYTTQKKFYTEMIREKPGWTLAGIYADEAISGTTRTKRKQFNIMMEDAINGKIDYIVTKSISRFARNTVDTLECVRQLRQLSPPVGIYFEKENIDTLDATGELILTILSALAQDESRSISDNIRWAIQKKFQRGEAIVDLNRMLGYDKGPDGEWLINPEQAEIVRYIFTRFTCGTNSNQIAAELNKKGIKTLRGCIWRSDAIMRILRNEKYVGDLECQKTVTKNFLTHETKINTGEAPKYYVKNHHAGIIDRMTWDKVQAILAEQKARTAGPLHPGQKDAPKRHRGNTASPFTNLVCRACSNSTSTGTVAQTCSARLVRMCYNNIIHGYTDSRCAAAEGLDPKDYKERYYYSYPVWRCPQKPKGIHTEKTAPSVNERNKNNSPGSIYEYALEQSFMEMLYKIKRDYEANGESSNIAKQFKAACKKLEQRSGNNLCSRQRLDTLTLQIKELEANLNDTMNRQSEATIHTSLAADIRTRLDELKKERDILETEQDTTAALQKNYTFFLRCLQALPEENFAGMKIRVSGIDTPGSIQNPNTKIPEINIAEAPDYLNFEKGFYLAFIRGGSVNGDTVLYKTNFGVTLTSCGNSRNLNSFLGFRKANADGTIDLLDEKWKIRSQNVCYTRKIKSEK